MFGEATFKVGGQNMMDSKPELGLSLAISFSDSPAGHEVKVGH